MDLLEVLARRRSVRSYLPDPPDEGDLNLILEAASTAPSAGDLQAYVCVVVRRRESLRRLADACYGQDFVAEAPAALVFLADPDRSARRYGSRGRNLYCVQDATIAASYAQLAAEDLGYGSCWVGAFDDRSVRGAVGAGRELIPIAVIPLGRPAEIPEVTPRRPIPEVFRLEDVGTPFPHRPVRRDLLRPAARF